MEKKLFNKYYIYTYILISVLNSNELSSCMNIKYNKS